MSQTDKKRRKLALAIGESFAAIRRRTARSQAWLSLSAPAMKIYIELKLRWRHKDDNNGQLFVSIAECKSLLGIAPGTAHRAFRELEEKGFIVMTRKGEAGKLNRAVLDNGGFGFSRKATTWAITEEPYRGQATYAFEKWTPPEKQIRGSTSGTTMVPPVERKVADGSTSGTYGGGFRAAHGSTSGIPVSTIYGVRSVPLVNPQSLESVHPKMADPSAGPCSQSRSPKSPASSAASGNGAACGSVHIAEHLAAEIRTARARLRWTQGQLAETAGTHQPIVSKIERGDFNRIGPETIVRVARAVGVETGSIT